MGAALCVVYIVAEAEHIFVKFVDILERCLHLDTVRFAFKIHRLVERLFLLIQIPDEAKYALRFMVNNMLRLF